MEEFLEGRKNTIAYSVFFDLFVPCATKKTSWDRRIAAALNKCDSNKDKRLCTISDEAFALLLLENSYDRRLDLFTNNKGPIVQRRGVKERGFQLDVPTLYTRGGIKYDKTDVTQCVKGWSDEGIARFNAIFDQVKADRVANPEFEPRWLESRRSAQEAEGGTTKKRKRQPMQARSELFESDDDAKIAPVDDGATDSDEESD